MGNIHREVCPINWSSRLRKEPKEVKRISRHQPVNPHRIKFFLIALVCPKGREFMHCKKGLTKGSKSITLVEGIGSKKAAEIYGKEKERQL